MRVRSVTYETAMIDELFEFYADTLELPVVERDADRFTVSIGRTDLTFESTRQENQFYHYAIRIPRGKLRPAVGWLRERTSLVTDETGNRIVERTELDSESIYFFDPADNLVELVVRDRLDDHAVGAFTTDDLRAVNEVGLPVLDVKEGVERLTENYPVDPLVASDGPIVRVGDFRGMFVVVEYERDWFVTDKPARIRPIEVTVESSKESLYVPKNHPYKLKQTNTAG